MKKFLLLFILVLLFNNANATDAEQNVEIGTHFVLTDQDNNEFDSAKISQKYLLVFFGYASCKSICPTALHDLSTVIKQRHDFARIFKPVMISLDPKADTPAKLKEFAKSCHEHISMLTGDEAMIKNITKKYKAYSSRINYSEKEAKENGEDYIIDHSSFIYIIDKNTGKYIGHSASDQQSLKAKLSEFR